MLNPTRFAALAAAFLTLALTGCAMQSPNYSPSIDNVETLKRSAAAPARVGTISVTAGAPGAASVNVRASPMSPSVGANYGDYIAAALRQELDMARLLDPKSPVEVSGALLANNIDAGGFSTAAGQIEVRFVVKSGDTVRFDKRKRVEHQWESSFMGAVAIPAAANNYPVMVQMLVKSLVNDPDFIAALRK